MASMIPTFESKLIRRSCVFLLESDFGQGTGFFWGIIRDHYQIFVATARHNLQRIDKGGNVTETTKEVILNVREIIQDVEGKIVALRYEIDPTHLLSEGDVALFPIALPEMDPPLSASFLTSACVVDNKLRTMDLAGNVPVTMFGFPLNAYDQERMLPFFLTGSTASHLSQPIKTIFGKKTGIVNLSGLPGCSGAPLFISRKDHPISLAFGEPLYFIGVMCGLLSTDRNQQEYIPAAPVTVVPTAAPPATGPPPPSVFDAPPKSMFVFYTHLSYYVHASVVDTLANSWQPGSPIVKELLSCTELSPNQPT